ncbi:MAG: YggS family pyridoxal phosphate-dependent enzyme [Planctomycetaceae bacterium]
MPDLLSVLEQNLDSVRQRIRAACDRVGRSVESVQLIAVTKYAPWEAVVGLASLGQRRFGENRPQQLLARASQWKTESPLATTANLSSSDPKSDTATTSPVPLEWHLIGQLQRNKVRSILPVVSRIHSVDSIRLLERIDEIAGELSLTPRVLLEVNVSGEESKHGFEPQQLLDDWEEIARLKQVHITGLMTMAPLADDPEQSRPWFRQLRELRDELRNIHQQFKPIDQTSLLGSNDLLSELSMGMSGDFEVAIEEGATHIRVGSSLFARLPTSH